MASHVLIRRPVASTVTTEPRHAASRRKPGDRDRLRSALGQNDLTPIVQTKLTLGASSDPLEKEADAIAEQVTNSGRGTGNTHILSAGMISTVQRKCTACDSEDAAPEPCEACSAAGDEVVARSASDVHSPTRLRGLWPDIATRITSRRGKGRRLPDGTREAFEAKMRHDFSEVHIHDDTVASTLNRQLGARAFTVGRDIFFGESQFQPNRREGDRLIAHELVHTIQQGAGRRDRVQRAPGAVSEDEITASDQAYLDAQRAAEGRGARLLEEGLELKQGQVDVRRRKSDLPCADEPMLNVLVSRVAGSLVGTAQMTSHKNVDEAIQSIAGHASASVSLIGPRRTARIIQTESPIDWSLRWFCPKTRTSGFTVDPGGTSGLAFASMTGTSGVETDSHEISTDSDKAGAQLVDRGKARVLQDVHNYGYGTNLARVLHGRASARGFDDKSCGYTLEEHFNATVGSFDKDENMMSRCYYSFVYRAERDALTGKITVSVRYNGADKVEGAFRESQ